MKTEHKETVRTDGKRKISIAPALYSVEGIDISFCRNGFQSVVVTVDHEMLAWLRCAIDEHLES